MTIPMNGMTRNMKKNVSRKSAMGTTANRKKMTSPSIAEYFDTLCNVEHDVEANSLARLRATKYVAPQANDTPRL